MRISDAARRGASLLLPEQARALRFRHRMLKAHGVAVGDEGARTVLRTRFGSNCRIRVPIFLIDSDVGNRSYIEAHCRIAGTSIGRFTAIAPGCHIGLAEHPSMGAASSHPIFYRRDLTRGFDFAARTYREETSRTTIGNDVWIGAGAIVKGGVHVGDGAIVGAGAVVTKDVAPYAVVAGVPARRLRFRFEREDVRFLEQLRWWDWDEGLLRQHHLAFHDVATLREIVERFDLGAQT